MTVDVLDAGKGVAAPNRAVGWWLLVVCALIFAMVVLGGVTRLTHSGLSMVEWRPVTGWLPPMGEAAWEAAFERYKQFPEYQKINLGMTLPEFKQIFWFEFSHRLLGRVVGVVFLLPSLYFLARGVVRGALAWRLAGIFVLGGLQGALGWYMVASGLVDRPDVSQYRLAAHLALAVLVYGACLWVALGQLFRSRTGEGGGRWIGALVVSFVVFVTIVSGAFVAGLDAGFLYNTFPLMDGRWVAEDVYTTRPLVADFFENRATVQFHHRLLALVSAVVIAVYWLWARVRTPDTAGRNALDILLGVLAIQVALGITALVFVVPVGLGAAHQGGALALVSAALVAAYVLRGARA